MKILIGYDGSASSDDALDDLRRAGLPRVSGVLVVSVADLLTSPPLITDPAVQVFGSGRATAAAALDRVHTQGEQVVKEAEAMASRAADRLRSEFPDWTVTDRVVTGGRGEFGLQNRRESDAGSSIQKEA